MKTIDLDLDRLRSELEAAQSCGDAKLAVLQTGLVIARAVSDQSQDEFGEREGTKHALHMVLGFLDMIGVQPKLRDPLYRLLLALDDLDAGIVGEIFRPDSTGKKPQRPKEQRAAKGWAAAAMDCLMQPTADGSKGLFREPAARRVARKIKDWPIARAQDFGWQTVAYWRDQVTGNGAGEQHDVDRAVFRALKQRMEGDHQSVDSVLRAFTDRPLWG